MQIVNEYLSTVPFDLYQLHLFRLVIENRSFTRAAEIAGLTQSAITRQIQQMENGLGASLVERTTRSVRPTAAGSFLFEGAARLVGDVDSLTQSFRVRFVGQRPVVRVGVSRSISMAYLPGFFAANRREAGAPSVTVVHQNSDELLGRLETNELDLVVLCPPKRISPKFQPTHRFQDDFTFITYAAAEVPSFVGAGKSKRERQWFEEQSWLLLDERSFTGQYLRGWIRQKRWQLDPAMTVDDFDLIINLVSLGMGVSLVPQRALALYGRRKAIKRIPLKERFSRELVVLARKHRTMPRHLASFMEKILF